MKRKKSKSVVKGGGEIEYGDLMDVMSPLGGMELMRQKDPMDFINQPMSAVAMALMNMMGSGRKKTAR